MPQRRPPIRKNKPENVGPAPLQQGGTPSEACTPAMKFIIHHWFVRPPGLYEEFATRRLEAALEEIRGEGWRDEIENLDYRRLQTAEGPLKLLSSPTAARSSTRAWPCSASSLKMAPPAISRLERSRSSEAARHLPEEAVDGRGSDTARNETIGFAADPWSRAASPDPRAARSCSPRLYTSNRAPPRRT